MKLELSYADTLLEIKFLKDVIKEAVEEDPLFLESEAGAMLRERIKRYTDYAKQLSAAIREENETPSFAGKLIKASFMVAYYFVFLYGAYKIITDILAR